MPGAAALVRALADAGFEVEVPADIRGVQWSKLVMNLNNAVGALTDVPTPRLIFEAPYRRIVAAVVAEALRVMSAAGIHPSRLGAIPVALVPYVLRLPTALLKVVARAQLEMDPEARSSMWQDLDRRRTTEVDFLNGEIVRLAENARTRAPLNARIVELVKAAEQKKEGSPRLSAQALWEAMRR